MCEQTTSSGSSSPIDRLDASGAQKLFSALANTDGPESEDALPSIDRYRLIERLGGGAGGDVYHAIREGANLPVALKLLRARLGPEPASRRAWRELDLMSQLHLAGVPRVLDYGVHDGHMFIVSEFVNGQQLLDYCGTHSLGLRARVNLLARVAGVVHQLNERGLIHRDIKPSNVMVDINGDPIIIDLGLAMLLACDPMDTLTEDGVPVGSPAFMAPEQAAGDRRRISTRSDVYGLGATAYRVLTGHTPHEMDASLHEALRRVVQDPPRDPRSLHRTLPRPLSAVLLKAVAMEADARYDSAAAFAADLRRWDRGEPVQANVPSRLQRMITATMKHPVIATTVACVAIALLTVVATWSSIWWLDWRPDVVRLSQDGRTVELLSRRRNVIREWVSPTDHSFASASLVPTARGMLVLIGATPDAAPEFAASLHAYDADRSVDPPLWTTSITPADLPADLDPQRISPTAFRVNVIEFADYLPPEGNEIAVVFQHSRFSPCMLRILDDRGSTLYQVWHDGNISKLYWMSGPRVLVASANNAEMPWSSRGFETDPGDPYPYVFFGVQPVVGHMASGFLPRGDPTSLLWYRCLLPPQATGMVTARFLYRPDPAYDRRSHVEISLNLGHGGANIHWVVDQHGRIVPGSHVINDPYRLEGTWPDAKWFKLDDLPPKINSQDP